jgi:hypothetical protein
MGGGKGGGAAAQARADEQARQERIRQGTERVGTIFDSQFNDEFFNNRRDAYMNYARPQLEDQYGRAQEELTYSLARGGNLNSSVRGEKAADLQQRFNLNQQEIADRALSQSAEARTQVEGARSDLVGMLNATGDAEGAANSATARASALTQPQAFSPLSNLFSDFTSALGTQSAIERANAYSGGQQFGRYDTGLFGPSRNSVQVSR